MKNATSQQIELAKKLGIDVSSDSARIAAAKIESEVYECIYPGKKNREATEIQLHYLESLGVKTESSNFIIVSALISEALEKRNIEAIEKLGLKPGDIIVAELYGAEQENVISSISSNMRIWLKGGQGRGCWPSNVIKKKGS